MELSNRRFEDLSKTWNQQFGKNWNVSEKKSYAGNLDENRITQDGIALLGSGGKSVLFLGKNYETTDSQGNRWFVSAGGKVSQAEGPVQHPAIVSSPPGKEGMPNQLKTGASKAYFTAIPSVGYDGYDLRDATASMLYDRLESADTNYIAGYKLLKTGEADTVFASIVAGCKEAIPLDSVFFARNDGTPLPFIRDGSQFKISVRGRQHLHADEVMEHLLMFKQSSYKNKNFELRPGSIHVLNVPDGNVLKSSQLAGKLGDFWDAYNKAFLEMLVHNKNKVNVVLVSDPRKMQVLRRSVNMEGMVVYKATIYSQELQFLSKNGVDNATFLGEINIELSKINYGPND